MKNIATSLVKAQKEFGPALKTATNPHFRSKYADLESCVEAVMDALNNNGIYLLQKTSDQQNGIMVETVFVHESGEMLNCGNLYFPASKNDAQGFMSALTYARRGSLMAACGIAPEDDDGNAGSKPAPKVTDATINALLDDIAESNSHDQLKEAFFKAIKTVGDDQKARDQITKAKDQRKATL